MYKALYILCFFCLHFSVNAQQHLFSNQRIGDVMPSYECYNVYQDSKGYIWFGTEGGLCRFNGSTIKVYTEKKGFAEKSCYGICEGPKGKLWFISSKNRVLYYDEKKDSICEAGCSMAIRKKLESDNKDQLYFVKSIGDSVLVFCAQSLTIRANIFTNVVEAEKFNFISNNTFYFKKQLNCLYPIKPRNFKGFNFKLGEIVVAIIDKDTTKTIIKWVDKQIPQWRCNTTANTMGDNFIGWDNKLIKVNAKKQIEVYTTGFNILSVYTDKNNGLWVGTLKGGVLYFENGNMNAPPINSLNGISVSGICEDNEKGMWCSTLERGIYYCKDKRVISYANLYGSDKTEGLLKAIDTNVFCYANNKDILCIGANSLNKYTFELAGGYGISDIARYKNGYLVTSLQSITATDEKFKTRAYLKERGNPQLIGASDICITPKGRVFFLQYGAVRELNDKNEILKERNDLKSGASCILSIENELLIGCKDGLYKVSLSDLKQEKIEGITGKVSALVGLKSGEVWIATKEEGLFVLKNGVLNNITNKSGLKKLRFFDLCYDGEGNIWAASNVGVVKINVADPTIFNIYSTKNGLASNQTSKITFNNGRVFVSTAEGLCSFPLKEDLRNVTAPQIYLSKLLVGDNEIAEKEILNLPYNYENLSLEFDALTFKEGSDANLIYILKGANTKNNKETALKGNTIALENLPPDNYTLSVYALNNYGVRSENPVRLNFTVNKAYWQTWWFYMICFVLLIVIVYAVVKIIVNRIKGNEEAKTKINKMLAEYQLTALQAQMNPHFIFNAINSIQGYILEKNEQQAYDYLAKFSKLIRMVLNNSVEKVIPLQQELEMLGLYIELEQLRFDKSFDFNLKVDEAVNVFEMQVPTMLVQPYVENAVWHGLMNLDATIKGVLNIDIRLNDDTLKITVEDNGNGREFAKTFAKQENHRSVGMKLTEQRLMMINTLQDYENAKVLVSDLHNEEGKGCGTRVEIFIPIK